MPKPTPADTAATPAPAKDESRAAGFMRSALAILGETGRADFTVLEVVERSKTSLRAFYQHFATKDDLLLALIDKIMTESCDRWRAEVVGLPSTGALRLVLEHVGDPASSTTQDSINRGLTFYNDHLMQSRPAEFARVLRPLHSLVSEILARGVEAGEFRGDIDVEATAAIVMQTGLGAMRLRTLSAEVTGSQVGSAEIHEFCIRGLAP
jgi:AcrR family transcriptional regulator